MSGAVNSQSCTTSLIHHSGSNREGTSSIHKWNQKQIWKERLIWGYHCRGPLKANAFPVLIPTVIRTSAPQTHLLPMKLIESYWLYVEVKGGWEREREREGTKSGAREWKAKKRKWNWEMSRNVEFKHRAEREDEEWGSEEESGKVTETGKEQIALPPC